MNLTNDSEWNFVQPFYEPDIDAQEITTATSGSGSEGAGSTSPPGSHQQPMSLFSAGVLTISPFLQSTFSQPKGQEICSNEGSVPPKPLIFG